MYAALGHTEHGLISVSCFVHCSLCTPHYSSLLSLGVSFCSLSTNPSGIWCQVTDVVPLQTEFKIDPVIKSRGFPQQTSEKSFLRQRQLFVEAMNSYAMRLAEGNWRIFTISFINTILSLFELLYACKLNYLIVNQLGRFLDIFGNTLSFTIYKTISDN